MDKEFAKKTTLLIALILVVVLISWGVGLNSKQIVSVSIFCLNTFATILFWKYRLPFAFLAVSTLMVLGLLDTPHLLEFASFDIILFLIGMMSIIGVLEESHFFEYIINVIMSHIGGSAKRMMIVMMLSAALFAGLVDEVTSILFMTAAMLYLTGCYGVNPVPFIMMIVFSTNIGSAATVVGNPVGVMIALNGGFSFIDFIRWATPISVVGIIITILICLQVFKKDIHELDTKMKTISLETMDKNFEMRKIRSCFIIFLSAILTLVFHHSIEELLRLEKNTMLIGTSMLYGGISMLWERDKAQEIIERRIDWWTLTFFILLFASVGTLKYVGVTQFLAHKIFSLASTSDTTLFISFTWISAIFSSILDNVLAIATFIPIVKDLSSLGAYDFPLWWGMLFAGTFFGNLTIIGSTANIIAVGMIERRRKIHITFTQWIRYGILVAVPTMIVATLMLLLQFPYMP